MIGHIAGSDFQAMEGLRKTKKKKERERERIGVGVESIGRLRESRNKSR
jgi:hypothetical protein